MILTVKTTLKIFKHSFILFVNIIKSVRKLYPDAFTQP